MAAISIDERGNHYIQFARVVGSGSDGKLKRKRETIRLGRGISLKATKRFAGFVDRLQAARATGAANLDADIVAFLDGLDDRFYQKLVKVRLVDRREPTKPAPSFTLEGFTTAYIKMRSDVKEDTRRGLENAKEELISYFGAERDFRNITEGEAQEFYQWMVSDRRELRGGVKGKLGPNTARRRAGRAKQFFAHAVRRELMPRNPFSGIKCRVGASPDRHKFIPQDLVLKVLEQIVDLEFRAAIILARWGGLRIPSELANMRWGDVDFDKKRLLVHVPKLEHIEGKETRLIPLFPEVEKALAALYSEPFGADEKVFRRLSDPTANLRTQFERYIIRAGIQPWPKLWQNLRASRATEIAETYPQHVATAWLGHTQAVAEVHYWKTREMYFDRAVNGTAGKCPECKAALPAKAKFCPACGKEIPQDAKAQDSAAEGAA